MCAHAGVRTAVGGQSNLGDVGWDLPHEIKLSSEERSREEHVSPLNASKSGMGRAVCPVQAEETEEFVFIAVAFSLEDLLVSTSSSGIPGIGEHCAFNWK